MKIAIIGAGDLTACRFIEPAMMLLVRLSFRHGPRVALQFEADAAA
jgi:hypothetical protein